MSIDILHDEIRPLDDRRLVEQAVIEAVGDRPGRWKAWLTQGGGEPCFSIRIDGPDGAEFSYRFLKSPERSPEFVRMKIQEGFRWLNGICVS
ncbi:MAG: hypothetical protein ACRD19_05170 [Terriglobia bacterium]